MFVFRFSWAVLVLLLVSVWAEELTKVDLLDTPHLRNISTATPINIT